MPFSDQPTVNATPSPMGQRRFGRVNWLGLWTLIEREVRRFLSVWSQTVLAPVATSVLFMVVFTVAFGSRRGEVNGVPFEQFLAPGLLMMVVIQNAFANTSSSLMIAKIQGNIVDTLMPPLSAGELLVGYGGAKVEPTKGDPRSGLPLRAVFVTFHEKSLGEKAGGNTF